MRRALPSGAGLSHQSNNTADVVSTRIGLPNWQRSTRGVHAGQLVEREWPAGCVAMRILSSGCCLQSRVPVRAALFRWNLRSRTRHGAVLEV